jgi:hypothetical protein
MESWKVARYPDANYPLGRNNCTVSQSHITFEFSYTNTLTAGATFYHTSIACTFSIPIPIHFLWIISKNTYGPILIHFV